MNIRNNAKAAPTGREHMVLLVVGWQTPENAARRASVCLRTVFK